MWTTVPVKEEKEKKKNSLLTLTPYTDLKHENIEYVSISTQDTSENTNLQPL